MEGTLQQINLSDIGDTVGATPSQRLRDSVERIGVIQPVILSRQVDDSGEIKNVIVDGNRRTAAARAAGLTTIPAVVFDGLDPNTIAEATLASNGFRSANYLAEFWALKHLERHNYTYDDLVATSGMAWSTIKNRRMLTNLNRDLFVALRYGQLSQSHALAIARLPRYQQDQLAEKFRKRGKVSQRDIQALAPSSNRSNGSGDTMADKLTEITAEASQLGYSKADFLEMAGRIWDETVNHQAEQTIIHDHAPKEPFPDLAAHKWDTGEG